MYLVEPMFYEVSFGGLGIGLGGEGGDKNSTNNLINVYKHATSDSKTCVASFNDVS